MKKDILTIQDLEIEDLESLLTLSAELKTMLRHGTIHQPLKGKTLGMIFRKPSTRTRISFEVGMIHLGGAALFLEIHSLQMGRGESVSDSAKIFSRYLDGLLVRTFEHSEIEEIAEHSRVPVINGLTNQFHPCQIIADLFTIQEKLGRLKGVRVTYVGDGNNVANSWLFGAAKMGLILTISSPPGYEPDSDLVEKAKVIAGSTGAEIHLVQDPTEAVKMADIVYTDVWTSMGDEQEREERLKVFQGYQVNELLLSLAQPDAWVMHCLPAHRGEEISAPVMDGSRSIVFDQAENRLHTQKAIMQTLLKNSGAL